jgi:hypothetical protein
VRRRPLAEAFAGFEAKLAWATSFSKYDDSRGRLSIVGSAVFCIAKVKSVPTFSSGPSTASLRLNVALITLGLGVADAIVSQVFTISPAQT